MIYKKNHEDPNKISNVNFVLKGNWKISIEENVKPEEFIYKKVDAIRDENLMNTYFCDEQSERMQTVNF